MRFSFVHFIILLGFISFQSEISANTDYPPNSNEKAAFVLDQIIVTDVTGCYGNSNGAIEIQVSGGQPPYKYSIYNGAAYVTDPATSHTFTGLTAGDYTIVVEDDYGERVSDIVTIDQPTQIFIDDISSTNVTGCYGNSNGTITISASNGTPPYTYSIDGGSTFFNNGGNFSGLPAGTYTIAVQDNNGCVRTGQTISLSQPVELEITNIGIGDIAGCYGDATGFIEITATGGSIPREYSINGIDYQAGYYFGGLTAGTYHVWVRDANGCIADGGEQIINQPDELIITNEIVNDVNTCFGENTGDITIESSGGSGDIQYSIDGGIYQISNHFPNLYAGNYSLAVRDQNSCITFGSNVSISQPDEIVINSETATNVTGCFGDETGEIIIDAVGGTSPLYFSIDNGSTFQTNGNFTNLPMGVYQTYLEDANGCYLTGESHFISQPSQIILDNASTTNVTTCFGDNNGTMTIIAYGGVGSLEYSPDDGTTWYPNNYITGLSAGSYIAKVRDVNQCADSVIEPLLITEPDEIQIISETPQDPNCFGGSDGQISIQATGGSGTIMYSVNAGTNYYLENVVTGLSAGISYNIMVMDGNNCTVTGGSYVLGEPPELLINQTNIQDVSSCHGGSNGSIEIIAAGGSGQIYYSIDGGVNYQTAPLFEGLTAGNYQIMIKDDNDCITVGDLAVLSEPPQLSVDQVLKTDIQGCNGEENGTVTIQASGGTAPLYYSIDGGITYFDNAGYFTNLPAGTYHTYVQDVNNCTDAGNIVTISQPAVLVLDTVAYESIQCQGQTNGEILIQASGGQFPYNYSIDGGSTYTQNNIFINLPAGVYQTVVKDSYGCILTGPEITINSPDPLLIDDITKNDIELCHGDYTGSINISASGGTPELLYSINNGYSFHANNGVFNNLSAGIYFIEVKDDNGCLTEATDPIEITQPPILNITAIETTDITCNGDEDGIIQINTQGGTGNIVYSIDGGANYLDNSGLFENLSSGSYPISVQDENGCTVNENSVSIYEPAVLVIDTVITQDELCMNSNDGRISIMASGGRSPFSYSADDITFFVSPTITGLAPGQYLPIVIDYNGCRTEGDSVTIDSPTNSSLYTAGPLEGCSPLSVTFTKTANGNTFLWDFGDGSTTGTPNPTHIFTNFTLQPVDYTVWSYALSANGCRDSSSSNITVYPQPQLNFTTHTDTLYYPDAEFFISNNSPAGYTDYLWSFGDGTSSSLENPGSHLYSTCGDYTIKMSAFNEWCTDSTNAQVVVTAHIPEVAFEPDTTGACFPATINFENISQNGISYHWDFDNGEVSEEFNASTYYTEPGNYRVVLSAEGYCKTYGEHDTIINIYDSPQIDFSAQPDSVMPPNQPVHCYNYSEGYELEYSWDFGDGTVTDEDSPIHYYTLPGEYEIQLTVLSGHNCIDSMTSTHTIFVFPYGVLEFPDAFTPNGDDKNDFFKPAAYESLAEYELIIYNRTGQLLFQSNDPEEGWDGSYQGNKAPQDIYVWRVTGKFRNGSPFERAGSLTLLK